MTIVIPDIPNEVGGGAGTEYTDGATPPTNPTGTALVFDNSGAWADVGVDNPLPVRGGYTEIAGQGTGVVNGPNTDLIPSTDVSAYKWFCLQVAGTWSGTLTFQASNDNVNFQSVACQSVASTSTTVTTTNNLFYGFVNFRYLRVRMTSFSSNTSLAGTLELYTSGGGYLAYAVTQNGTWTVQPGNTPNTTPWLFGRLGVAILNQASAAQATNGNSADLTVSAYTEIALDVNMTAQAGTNPTVQFFWDRKGADGIYYNIYQSVVYSTLTTLSTAIGAGMTYNTSLGTVGRLRWVIGGTASPSYTFSASVIGK